MQTITIRFAVPADAALVAAMATSLTDEIMDRTNARHFNIDADNAVALCRRYLESGAYLALIAVDGRRALGFCGMCESHALYADGSFGIIQEFYVIPELRSDGIGTALLEQAMSLARSKGWKRLELCTPPLPEFQRSLDFYERNGFEITGGRKMKRIA